MSPPYEAALADRGLEDVQPRYRRLLVELKRRDAGSYERAVARYKEEVETCQDDPSALTAWVGYGAWLASELAPGQLVSIDKNGRSRPISGSPPLGTFLMQIPSESRQRALVVTLPLDPSDAQREAVSLLCEN